MFTLALETIGTSGAIALLDQERLVASLTIPENQRSAQSLAPAIQQLLREHNQTPREMGLWAVAIGPGSFTGIRVGVTTAKVLAYATGGALVGINALDAIAYQSPRERPLWALLDAYRGQLFAARYPAGDGELPLADHAPAMFTFDEFLASLRAGDTVSGPVLKKIASRLPSGVGVTGEETWALRAETIGRMALARFRQGSVDDPTRLLPLYVRPSAAEEKWAARESSGERR